MDPFICFRPAGRGHITQRNTCIIFFTGQYLLEYFFFRTIQIGLTFKKVFYRYMDMQTLMPFVKHSRDIFQKGHLHQPGTLTFRIVCPGPAATAHPFFFHASAGLRHAVQWNYWHQRPTGKWISVYTGGKKYCCQTASLRYSWASREGILASHDQWSLAQSKSIYLLYQRRAWTWTLPSQKRLWWLGSNVFQPKRATICSVKGGQSHHPPLQSISDDATQTFWLPHMWA